MDHFKRFHHIGCLLVVIIFILTACAHNKSVRTSPEGQKNAGASAAPQTAAAGETGGAPADNDEFDFPEESEEPAVRVADPLYPLNFIFFHFNDKLYFWVLKPAARGYNFVLREDLRQCVRNFFSNILTPVRLVNCLLQGKIKAAGTETARFLANTTMGVFGFGDAGKEVFHLEKQDEDLGQTLGFYGIGNGIYLVWPVLGPSTLRDTVGRVGDSFANPISYIDPTWASVAVGGYNQFNDLSLRIGEYESVKEAAIEPYSAIRNGYIQHRQSLVEQ